MTFERFMAGGEDSDVRIDKQQDKISRLRAKAEAHTETRNEYLRYAAACQAALKSNAYPVLDPVFRLAARQSERNAKKEKQRFRKTKKEIRKTEKKIRKLKQKQQRKKLLKALLSPDGMKDAETYINGLQALKEESMVRTKGKLSKAKKQRNKAEKALRQTALSDAERHKIGQKVVQFESRIEKLEKRINNLTELEQGLDKAAKMGIIRQKLEEMKNTVMATAEKAAANESSISQTIDAIALSSSETLKEIIEQDENKSKEKTDDQQVSPTAEKESKKSKETQELVSKDDLRKRAVSETELSAIVNAGIPVSAVKNGDKVMIFFNKSLTERINQAVANMKNQTMKR